MKHTAFSRECTSFPIFTNFYMQMLKFMMRVSQFNTQEKSSIDQK